MPDPLADLGVRHGANGGELRLWSASATRIDLCLFDERDPDWVADVVAMTRGDGDVWVASSTLLVPGVRYSIRASGPTAPGQAFNSALHLIDPYARGLARTSAGDWRGYVQEPDSFDWADSTKPRIGIDHTVLYEAHVRGISKLNPGVPEELRGTYAGLAHPSTIAYLKDLGVTTIELLPVHQFVS